MITASGYKRARACPSSIALPQANTTNAYAEAGTGTHGDLKGLVEAHQRGDDVEASEQARAAFDLIPPELLPVLRCEVAYAYDAGTGLARELGQDIGRQYTLNDGEVAGTADMVAVTPGGVFVLEFKSGHLAVDAPDKNDQLRLLALMVASANKRQDVTVGLLQAPEGRPARIAWADLDMFDIEGAAAEVAMVVGAVAYAAGKLAAGTMPDVTEGPHCRHCPASHVCPAKTALIRRLADGSEAADLALMQPLSPATAGIAYRRLQAAKNLLRTIESAVMACLDEHGELPLPDGPVLRKVIGEGNEKLDGETVWEVVRDLHGDIAADESVERHATKKRLGEAMRKRFGRKGAEEERRVLATVRGRGGATRGTTEKLVEVEPEAKRLAR